MIENEQGLFLSATDPEAIVQIYRDTAAKMFALSNDDAGYFFLTHAFIHALEAGLPDANELEQLLRKGDRM